MLFIIVQVRESPSVAGPVGAEGEEVAKKEKKKKKKHKESLLQHREKALPGKIKS